MSGHLGFGYNAGLPAGTAVAWGCRAIVTQTGMVDFVHDRQSMFGTEADKARLLAALDVAGMAPWRNRAAELLRSYEMRTREPGEFVLFEDDTVRIVGNTNGSGGYLYVAAYLTKED